MTDYDFPDEVLVYEGQPQGYGSEIFSYTPSQLLTQIRIHSEAILAIPLASWVNGIYQTSNDWRFIMDNYLVLVSCYKALGDAYREKIWDTMIEMVIIVACLAVILVLALVGQIFLIFQPLLGTATMASSTLLRELPISLDILHSKHEYRYDACFTRQRCHQHAYLGH